jgi:hypothetical protein
MQNVLSLSPLGETGKGVYLKKSLLIQQVDKDRNKHGLENPTVGKLSYA